MFLEISIGNTYSLRAAFGVSSISSSRISRLLRKREFFGYTGGNPLVINSTYQQVCSGTTDHAEAVKIEFDPSILTYELVGG